MLIIDQAASASGDPFISLGVSFQHPDNEDTVDAKRKGKGKATVQDASEPIPAPGSSSEAFTVDWTKYEPPEGLRDVGDVDSEIIRQIIQESIDRVKARIVEEKEKRKIEAEKGTRGKEEAATEEDEETTKSNGTEGLPDEDSAQADIPDWPLRASQDAPYVDNTSESRPFPADLPKRPEKRRLLNFFRKLNGSPEHGESSASGAARSRFLSSPSQVELKTHLARKRFVSDLIKKAPAEDASAPEPEVECVSCLDDFARISTVRAPCHNYCVPCFHRLIASACQNEQHWPPKCCLNTIPETTIHTNVDKTQWAEYRERAIEWNQPVSDRMYCSQPECGQFIRPEYIILAQGVARCTDGHYTCLHCRNAQHEGDNCPQDEDLARTNELAEAAGWRRCITCQAFVEHSDGCQHMTCRCGAEFCYVCGARWRTCGCTTTHLALFKQAAEERRQERLEQEAHEEAELQEALRLVAEFEREEEANAAAQLARERALAEERWQRRYKELEASRREAAARFADLRDVVAELHEAQRVDALERETHGAKIDERIARREGKSRAEYVARAVEEKRIEEEYAVQLRAFWEGKKGGEEAVAASLKELRKRMDGDFLAWQKWCDDDLDAYRHSLREEQAIRAELMEEKERRLESRTREVGLGVAKRKMAELRWVREVFEERGRLLDELEASEIEKLGDVADEYPGDSMEEDDAWVAHLEE